MPSLETVRAYGDLLDDVSTMATRDLVELYRQLDGEAPPVVRDALLEALPPMIDPYAAAMGDLSAEFYGQVRSEAGVSSRYSGAPLELPDTSRYEALTRWGVTPLFEQSTTTVLSLLVGGMSKIFAEQAGGTIYANAQRDPVAVRYQRVPSAGCCVFCGMLAARGGDYASEESAIRVAGRGQPVPKVRRRGGQGRGIRVRGTQRIGDKFHDHCKCKASPVFPGEVQEMPPVIKEFEDAYGTAAVNARKKLNAEGSPGFGDSKAHRKMLLAEMRELTGAK